MVPQTAEAMCRDAVASLVAATKPAAAHEEEEELKARKLSSVMEEVAAAPAPEEVAAAPAPALPAAVGKYNRFALSAGDDDDEEGVQV